MSYYNKTNFVPIVRVIQDIFFEDPAVHTAQTLDFVLLKTLITVGILKPS